MGEFISEFLFSSGDTILALGLLFKGTSSNDCVDHNKLETIESHISSDFNEKEEFKGSLFFPVEQTPE